MLRPNIQISAFRLWKGKSRGVLSLDINPTDRRIFRGLMDQTRICLRNQKPGEDPLACETAYLSKKDDFTYHTHPFGTPEPSEVDRETTSKLGKRYMIIGLVPQRKIVVFSAQDGFRRIIADFQV